MIRGYDWRGGTYLAIAITRKQLAVITNLTTFVQVLSVRTGSGTDAWRAACALAESVTDGDVGSVSS